MEKKRILLVEDDADQALALSIRLRKADYFVLRAEDAMQGAMLAKSAKPDLVILDLGLPAGGGFALMENTRHIMETNWIPIIVLTARDAAANRERAMSLGASAFFQKPVDSADLLAAIRQILEQGVYTANVERPADAPPERSVLKAEQVRQWRAALRESPGNPAILNDLAWVLATARDPELQHVPEARQIAAQLLVLAKSALPAIWHPSAGSGAAATPPPESPELVRRKELAMALLDTLAAIHAADGQFPRALDFARKGLSLAQELGLHLQAHEMSDRIRLYESGKPFVADYP